MSKLGEGKSQALFVTNLELNEYEGIYKKIYAEATAIGNAVGNCFLILKDGKGSILINTQNGTRKKSNLHVLKLASCILGKKRIQMIYIRLMVPNFRLISFMRKAKSNGVKIFYEIPTYPYYGEQYKASRKKYRAVAKIAVDAFFSPFIKFYVDRIVIIKSSSKIKLHKKMIEITNGVQTESIQAKRYTDSPNNVFRMVTVGTLYPYHGYDRVLKGLKACKEMVDGIPVEFHIVGSSQTIDELKMAAKKLGLSRVIFHGVKTTEELNTMYEQFDVGLGCLALHRRNADIDTTLKIIEYYCRGIPVVTSGISPYQDDPAVTITVPDGEDAVDICYIYREWKKIENEMLEYLSERAKERFSWDSIMGKLLKTCL